MTRGLNEEGVSKLADVHRSADAVHRTSLAAAPRTGLDVRDVSHRFGEKLVLSEISLRVGTGDVHALLGPNGAGKTTLIRILAGLLHPTAGSIDISGLSPTSNARVFRQRVGFVPSGDRTFYLRISGLENLVFFARLHGMRRRDAVRRALAVLADVGLEDAARVRVADYSHGMQKRLSVARALLTSPPVLLVDEATHDLDPKGARLVRDLVAAAALQGAVVVWATQRLDEIRGFAHAVTLLDRGQVRFSGTVPELMSYALPRRFVLHVQNGRRVSSERTLEAALGGRATLARIGEKTSEHYLLSLADGVVLSDAVASLAAADVKVVSCREDRSEIEEAFLLLTEESAE